MSFKALLEDHAPGRPTVVTVGTFDGVHHGHRKILARTVEIARESGAQVASVAIMFRKAPRAVIMPNAEISYLCPLKMRERLIRETGIDTIIAVDFDESIRLTAPREFAGILHEALRMGAFVSGPGSAVGRDRSGDSETMRRLGEEMGFSLHTVPPEIYNGEAVSSTLVRTALEGGRMGEAAGMLGRRYTLAGKVVRGEARGRTIGFPTVNLDRGDPEFPAAVPADGIYATWARVDDGAQIMAATSIGVRPTFGDEGSRTVEAHLLDFDEDVYGRTVTLEFVRRLRPERKFDTVDEVTAHMNVDVEKTREILSGDATAGAYPGADRQ